MALPLNHQTPAQFADKFWARVRAVVQAAATAQGRRRKELLQAQYARLMWQLTEWIIAGDVTDAQARASFNAAYGRTLNATQWTTLRTTRITPAHDRYAALIAEGDL